MNKILLLLLVAVVFFFPLGAWASEKQASLAGGRQGNLASEIPVQLISQNEKEIVLNFSLPVFAIKNFPNSSDTCQKIIVPGLTSGGAPGAPDLPVSGALVGIPLDAEVEFVVVKAEYEAMQGKFNLCPAAQPVWAEGDLLDPNDLATPPIFVLRRDSRAYSQNTFTPQHPADLMGTGFMRSQRVAQVRFNPFQYNPATGELRTIQRLQVALRFSFSGRANHDWFSQPAITEEGDYESILRNVLLNYDQARGWRTVPSVDHLTSPQSASSLPDYQLKILVDREGVYTLTYADLAALGVDPQIFSPQSFRIFNMGAEMAIQVVGEEDESFDPDDSILFYGQGVNTKYTADNVYYLQASVAVTFPPAKRIIVESAAPNGAERPDYFIKRQRFEINYHYLSNYPSGEARDTWYWDFVNASSAAASKTITVTVNHLAVVDAPATATIRGLLRSYRAKPQHHTRIYINGHLVDDAFWPADSEYAFEIEIPHTYLLEGANQIKLECPRDSGITDDFVLINYYELEFGSRYAADQDRVVFDGQIAGENEFRVSNFSSPDLELFDITDPRNVIMLMDFEVQSEELLANQTTSSYSLVFGRDVGLPARRFFAQTLARRLSPRTISIDSISNLQDSSNRADYIVITHPDFAASLQPLLAHRASQGLRVMLVDIFDVYDEFSYGIIDPQAVRSFLAYAYQNWTPPAPLYVLLVGDGHFDPRGYRGYNDPTFIPPYLQPEVDPFLGETVADNRMAMIVGDDTLPDMALGRIPARTAAQVDVVVNKILSYETAPPTLGWTREALFVADNKDTAGDFQVLSDTIINLLPSGYMPKKVYLGITHNRTEAQQAIRSEINQGVLLVNYIGHAGATLWASESLLNASSVAALTNVEKLAFFVPMTCLEGSYHYPHTATTKVNSLADLYLFHPNGGAVGSWSPTGLGVATGHDFLNRGMYQAFFRDGIKEVGLAAMQGQLMLAANSGGAYLDLLDTYLIFGDPALRLRTTYAYYIPLLFNVLEPER
jgi:hypothetical protein